jgi:ABC-type multidrug transport system fused ATPase/permease subunit
VSDRRPVDDNSIGAEAGATTDGGRFYLDMMIENEGRNLSVGERSLVSLARALVRDVS